MKTYPSQTASQQVSKRSTVEVEYDVPNGKLVRINRFFGGHEYTTKEARVELVLRDGGDTILAVGYLENFDIRDVGEVTGDGSKQIVIRLVNNDTGTLHMTGMWRGDEKTPT